MKICAADAQPEDHLRRNASSGVRGILIYCADFKCGHHVAVQADRWPDHIRLSDLEPRCVCQACGSRGGEVRPDFAPARMGCR